MNRRLMSLTRREIHIRYVVIRALGGRPCSCLYPLCQKTVKEDVKVSQDVVRRRPCLRRHFGPRTSIFNFSLFSGCLRSRFRGHEPSGITVLFKYLTSRNVCRTSVYGRVVVREGWTGMGRERDK